MTDTKDIRSPSPLDWLSGDRPPLPRREPTPLLDQIHAELRPVEWPSFDEDTLPHAPILPRLAGDEAVTEVFPAVAEAVSMLRHPVKYLRGAFRTWQRKVAGSASALVLVVSCVAYVVCGAR